MTTAFPRGAAALLAAGLLAAAPAAAFHDPGAAGGCYLCHSLDLREADPETSAISAVTRTLPLMKVHNGGRAPERFGCTYCHNDGAAARMKGVLEHFRGFWASRHPVGSGFSAAGAPDSANEYLSTVGSATPGELDCLDCHDVALVAPDLPDSYLGHVPPGEGARAGNHTMLRGVGVAGEYDEFCRACHVNAGAEVKGTRIVLASHADAGPGGPLRESDGTAILATAAGGGRQCTTCHDTHFSTLVRLFNDGHEGDAKVGATNCTALCHYAGGDAGYVDERENEYVRSGHGMPESTYKYRGGEVDYGGRRKSMGMSCGACHAPLDTGTLGPGRKPHVERTPPGATPAERYQRRYNISLSLQDEGVSRFGNPIHGVCENCHAGYAGHPGGEAGGAAGCLDCHDEHAEGTGPDNVFMIPRRSKREGTYGPATAPRAGTGAVTYAVPRLDPEEGTPHDEDTDFFRDDGAGACDSAECHPAFSPLADFLSDGEHPGGDQDAGADCGACHRHAEPAGAWRATSP